MSGTVQADPSEEAPTPEVTQGATCVRCGKPLARVLESLGSLLCHDCRDGDDCFQTL